MKKKNNMLVRLLFTAFTNMAIYTLTLKRFTILIVASVKLIGWSNKNTNKILYTFHGLGFKKVHYKTPYKIHLNFQIMRQNMQ